MNKIICDVCGTSYPETETQCPICGCARPGDTAGVSGETGTGKSASSYNFVRGGHFSKGNVRRRNNANQPKKSKPADSEADRDDKKANIGLVITAILLLLAIIAVVIYICLRVFMPDWIPDFNKEPAQPTGGSVVSTGEPNEDPQQTDDGVTEPEETEPQNTEIPCTGITVSNPVVELDKIGSAVLLNVTLEPADTTDKVTYASDDETIATVTSEGKVVVIAPGQAIITVTCGEFTAECRVICTAETEPPTEAPTEAPTEPEPVLQLNRDDFTLFFKGETWQVYDGEIDRDEITWSIGNEAVATVERGRVTAVGPGMTTLYAEYRGVKVSCIVRCSFAEDPTEPEETEPNEPGIDGSVEEDDGGQELPDEEGTVFTISHTDVTIAVGETFYLTLSDENGNSVDVTWTAADSAICTISGNAVKGAASGKTMVTAVHKGQTFSCIVRVK